MTIIVKFELTTNSGGTDPGFMLLAEEYIFGVCLSCAQRRHSVSSPLEDVPLEDAALTPIPGKLSWQVIVFGTFKACSYMYIHVQCSTLRQ